MRRVLPFCAALLAAGCGPGQDRSTTPPEPDWGLIEIRLSSQEREERREGVRALLLADEDSPGTIARLAELPDRILPGLRHYTSAAVLVALHGRPGTPDRPRSWIPSKRTLELLIAGLEDGRSLPVGGAADWDPPVGRFCQDALELLTGEVPPPRPINVMPSREAAARWRRWWEENHPYLCFDAERGVWAADPTARRLGIPLGAR